MNYALYGGKHQLVFMPSAHRYKLGGQFKPGVTTILGILGKDHLIQWSANMASELWRDTYIDGEDREALHQLAKRAWSSKRDSSADTGTKVHEFISAALSGREVPEVSRDMVPSLKAFDKWFDKVKPKILASEQPVYSESMDYCGMYDLRYKTQDGTTVIADFKTGEPQKEFNEHTKRYSGRTRAYPEAFMQVAAYDLAFAEEHKTQAHVYEVVYITKSGKLYDFTTSDKDRYKQAWRSLVGVYKPLQELKRNKDWS